MGEIAFLDRPGGGTHVRIAFDSERLAKLASESGDVADAGNPKSDDEAEEIG
jgi:two-component system nitrogen regulation sensor histidine kinase NtrY